MPAGEQEHPRELGRFRIEGVLGRGGMGIVYRAIDDRLGRTVALKLLPDELAGDGERRRRLLREAKVAATVNHPNIATIYEVGESDGRMFIAMEYVDGRSLRDRLADTPLAIAETLAIARQILAGLGCAHDAGITHRDLKPDNVMITPDGTVKVLDFGLAKHHQEQPTSDADTQTQQHAGQIRGTPGYMSPEQARGAVLDARSDIFSFGVMLYELATGTRPFSGVTPADVVSAILRDDPAPAITRNPAVTPVLASVITRCLAKQPSDRFTSCAAIVLALDESPQPVRVPIAVRRILIGSAVAGIIVAAGLFAIARLGESAPNAPSSSEPTIDPPSTNPDAVRLYRAAIKAVRDGRMGNAWHDLDAAVAADPGFGAAHLQRALSSFPRPSAGRESFRRALALRDSLSPRDRDLFDAMEPTFLRQPSDVAESTRRLEVLAKRYPRDGEILYWLAHQHGDEFGTSPQSQIEDYGRVVAIDPDFAQARASVAESRGMVGDFDGERRELDRCLDRVPSATVCMYTRIDLNALQGECARVEADARTWLTIEPDVPDPHFALANALEGQGRSLASVRQAMQALRMAALPEPRRAEQEARDEQTLAILAGDFTRALELDGAIVRLAGTSGWESDHAEAARRLAVLLEEVGRVDEAARVGASFLEARDAWEPNPRSDDWAIEEDPTGILLAIARRGGVMSAEHATTERDLRLASWQTRAGRFRGFLWVAFYAAGVETTDDARLALAALPRFGLPPSAPRPRTDVDGAIGRTLYLGGRVAEALPILERAARACHALRFPIEHVRASFFLGEARAANHDTAGACAAYRVVLDRWGAAKPRSVTAERARARSLALGCPPP